MARKARRQTFSPASREKQLDPTLAQPDQPPIPEPPVEEKVAREPSRFRKLLTLLGPGLTSGASNNDCSAIATYALAGATFGFALLWFAPVVFPMVAVVVYLSAKLAMVTGSGLAGVMRRYFSRWIMIPAVLGLFVANTIAAGADLAAVSEGVSLLAPVSPMVVVAPIAILLLALQIWGSYRIVANIFKWLAFVQVAFIIAALLAKPDWGEVLVSTVRPQFEFNTRFLSMLVAMLGAALSPYLYFWQSSQRVEEEVCMGRHHLWQRRGATDDELKYAQVDVNVGMGLGCLIIYSIILTNAVALFGTGANIETAADAAQALKPFAGRFASIVFALGFIGTGMLAIPVLTTGASYALCEAFNWKYGLEQTVKGAPQFYAIIVISTLLSLGLNFLGVSAIRALFIASVINGVLTPPLLIVIMRASDNPNIVGKRFNRRITSVIGWITMAFSALAVLALLVSYLAA